MILPWTSDTNLDIYSQYNYYKKQNLHKNIKITLRCYNGAQKYRTNFLNTNFFFLVCATQPTHCSNEIIQTNKLTQN